jgi:hypothetical protein
MAHMQRIQNRHRGDVWAGTELATMQARWVYVEEVHYSATIESSRPRTGLYKPRTLEVMM